MRASRVTVIALAGLGSCVEYPPDMTRGDTQARPILAAELLSIGSELTTGETRDTNAGELARVLSGLGVRVGRIQALPDDLDAVAAAFADALERVDLVVSTGGLGPTPDDLTREAIATVSGETPAIDEGLERWLRGLWDRRGLPFAEINLKQAWLIPSATAIPNPNGTAPGWWVDRPDGRVVVALPGPPREMRPMWADWVLPRLRTRGLGQQLEVRTLRLTGIGESQVAVLLGDTILHGANPVVATYARSDAVDVRIAAIAEPADGRAPRRTAAEIADAAEAEVLAAVGDHVWARGDTTWPQAIGARLDRLGWRLAAVEIGLGGELTALFGAAPWLARSESIHVVEGSDGAAGGSAVLEAAAERARHAAGGHGGRAGRATARDGDTAVSVAVASPAGTHTERRLAFLGGPQGRSRAALTAAAVLLGRLNLPGPEPTAAEARPDVPEEVRQ